MDFFPSKGEVYSLLLHVLNIFEDIYQLLNPGTFTPPDIPTVHHWNKTTMETNVYLTKYVAILGPNKKLHKAFLSGKNIVV